MASAPSISMPLPFGIGDSAVGRSASLQPSGLPNAAHNAGLQQSMPACSASTGALKSSVTLLWSPATRARIAVCAVSASSRHVPAAIGWKRPSTVASGLLR